MAINAKVHPNPVFVLGNQKAGTSAIAALLAELTGFSVSIDLRQERYRPNYHNVKKGELSFSDLIKINKLDFSREIIKEPNLTLFYKDLKTYFPNSQFIFVCRDPRDNIRSLLNRLKIPGHLSVLEYESQQKITPAWKLIMDIPWIEYQGKSYIERLAERWNFIIDVFLNNQEQFTLIRYEDFIKNKEESIVHIAREIDLNPVNDISRKINIQFQPSGNRNIKWKDFFGDENLSKIEKICGDKMKILNYYEL